ncbi:SusC/RagA family TonB-linked outer membrane protein [Flavitalea flava]
MKRKLNGWIQRSCIIILFTLCITTVALAQKKVTGTVINGKDKQPLGSVTVIVKGTKVSSATLPNGEFVITVPTGRNTLIFSSVGFETTEVNITTTDKAVVSLNERTSSLDEVVVTGYTAQKKKDLTGSVTVVNVGDLNKQPSSQIENQLQGQAAGVTVIGSGQPGEEPQIRIRGINTFGDNTPLFVVDGTPTTTIADINSNDVASIQILKDAGAASIYGSRASNGVIIITTKKGKIGKPVVTYDAYYGRQIPRGGNIFHTLNPQDQAQLKYNANANSTTPISSDPLYGNGATPILPDYIFPVGAHEGDPSVDPSTYYVNPNYTDPAELADFRRIVRANKSGTDWYHELFKNAPITSHNLSVSGASDKAKYLLSVNYFNQQGNVINTYIKRYTLRANTTFNVSKSIRIGENLAYSISQNPKVDNLTSGSAIGFAFRQEPLIPVYDIKGNYAGNFGGQLGDAPNPVATQKRKSNDKTIANRLFGNLFAEVDIMKDLTFRTSFGGEISSGYSHNFVFPTYENQENTTTNNYAENSFYNTSYTWTNTVNYRKVIHDDHSIQILLGTEAIEAHDQTVGGTTYGYLSFDPNYVTLTSGSGTVTNFSTRSAESLWSQFGRLDYGYKDKYLISGTVRRDGSSKFLTYQYGWFPAVTAAWRISQESFLQNLPWLTDLKIRGGWGVMGNQINLQTTNGYSTFTQNKNSSFYDITGSNTGIQQGVQVGQIGNPDAKWEKDGNTNIGFDATLFRGAISISADYYQKKITDMLFNAELPGTFGRGVPAYQNVASSKNNGVDITLSANKQVSKDLKLDATLTLTTYNNKITRVTTTTSYFLSGDGRDFGSKFVRNQVGSAVGSFYGYKIGGFWNDADAISQADAGVQQSSGNPDAVYQADAGVGRFRYTDVNKDGQIDDNDRTLIGNPNPKYTYGINLGATYKSFDLSIFLYGSQGGQLWNQVLWWTDFYPSFTTGKSKTALFNSWTPTNHNAKAPLQETAGYASTNGSPNSYYIENGSYLRAKNLMLGYTFPKTMLQKIGIESFRLYAQVTNLFTITKYSGPDPEINGTKGVQEFGIDEGSYPSARQVLVGVNVKF